MIFHVPQLISEITKILGFGESSAAGRGDVILALEDLVFV